MEHLLQGRAQARLEGGCTVKRASKAGSGREEAVSMAQVPRWQSEVRPQQGEKQGCMWQWDEAVGGRRV